MIDIKLSELVNAEVPVFQGDLMIRAASRLPDGVKQLGTNVVAHSETGHHHVAVGADVLGGLDPMVMFLRPDGKHQIDGVPFVDIVHERPTDKHETYRLFFDLPSAVPVIQRQEEWSPEGWRVVAD